MSLGRLVRKNPINNYNVANALFGSLKNSRNISSSSNIILKKSPCLSKQALLPNSLRPLYHAAVSRTYFSDSRDREIAWRYRRRTGINLGINFVPQQEAYVIERFGKFTEILEPGLHLLVPIVDQIAYVHSLKEQTIEIPEQPAVTTDNVSIHVDGVLYATVIDPKKASYNSDNPMIAVTQLAQTVMRSCIGKMPLDKTFMERETLNANIVVAINKVAVIWGLSCRRYEIRDIIPPRGISASMEMQAEAERKKRAEIIEAEGRRQAIILKAEAAKTDAILRSEAAKINEVNKAAGEAEARLLKSKAEAEALLINSRAEAESKIIQSKAAAEAIAVVAEALNKEGGKEGANLQVAHQYVQAFGNLAKESTTVLLPSNLDNPSSMVTQAMTLYKKLIQKETQPQESDNRSACKTTAVDL